MVPGIAEREIRHHANHRQEWLQSDSAHSTNSRSGHRFGTRAALGSVVSRVQHALASLVCSKAASQAQTERTLPVRLEIETAQR